MIAFTLFGRPIYWYGIFYLITFVSGYVFLRYLGSTKIFEKYSGLQSLLTDKRDDLMLVGLFGVIAGGRLGHVLLYDFSYYMSHPGEIILVNQGGMSFIGGVIGVVLGLFYLTWKLRLTKTELFLLGDIILCIVPLGSLLGRIGNFLNQELRGIPIDQIPEHLVANLRSLGLIHVYDQVDQYERINTNLIQAGGEGLLPLLIGGSIMMRDYLKGKIRPGLITGLFLMTYATVRFFVEFLKDLPNVEMWGPLSVSQWIMLVFFAFGIWFTEGAQKNHLPNIE